jgi:hypothetical protein
VMKEPLLYLSLFFKANRDRYYELLQAVRLRGALGGVAAVFPRGCCGHRGAGGGCGTTDYRPVR